MENINKKEDLRDLLKQGKIIVVLENGGKGIVWGDKILDFYAGYMDLDCYDEELRCGGEGILDYSIKEIYRENGNSFEMSRKDISKLVLLWKRKEKVDWSKIEVDTKILLRGKIRYFSHYNKKTETVFYFANGTTSFTQDEIVGTDERNVTLAEE